jgi:hypothetical protein
VKIPVKNVARPRTAAAALGLSSHCVVVEDSNMARLTVAPADPRW